MVMNARSRQGNWAMSRVWLLSQSGSDQALMPSPVNTARTIKYSHSLSRRRMEISPGQDKLHQTQLEGHSKGVIERKGRVQEIAPGPDVLR